MLLMLTAMYVAGCVAKVSWLGLSHFLLRPMDYRLNNTKNSVFTPFQAQIYIE